MAVCEIEMFLGGAEKFSWSVTQLWVIIAKCLGFICTSHIIRKWYAKKLIEAM